MWKTNRKEVFFLALLLTTGLWPIYFWPKWSDRKLCCVGNIGSSNFNYCRASIILECVFDEGWRKGEFRNLNKVKKCVHSNLSSLLIFKLLALFGNYALYLYADFESDEKRRRHWILWKLQIFVCRLKTVWDIPRLHPSGSVINWKIKFLNLCICRKHKRVRLRQKSRSEEVPEPWLIN